MGNVFRRAGSKVWTGAFRAWNAQAGAWIWLKRSTGQTEKMKALVVVAQWERAAGMAESGKLTRAKALEVVNDILRLAGRDVVVAAPSMAEHVRESNAKDVAPSTARKLERRETLLADWAGDKMQEGVDAWTAKDVKAWYAWISARVGETTAHGHMKWLRSIFARARDLGYRQDNPASTVNVSTGNGQTREVITRGEQATILRAMRRAGALDWLALCAMGWHTGHRIQDVLSLTADSFRRDPEHGWLVSFNPAKKRGKGRTVVLPVPTWLARLAARLDGFSSINNAKNDNGRVSGDFIAWLRTAGVDPQETKIRGRVFNRVSFHSYRHGMASRLAAAGVSGEIARLVTDHDSPKVMRSYVHAEIVSLADALRKARRK